MVKLWLNRGRHSTLEKWKKKQWEKKKRAHELGQLATLLVALTAQLKEGKAYLH